MCMLFICLLHLGIQIYVHVFMSKAALTAAFCYFYYFKNVYCRLKKTNKLYVCLVL